MCLVAVICRSLMSGTYNKQTKVYESSEVSLHRTNRRPTSRPARSQRPLSTLAMMRFVVWWPVMTSVRPHTLLDVAPHFMLAIQRAVNNKLLLTVAVSRSTYIYIYVVRAQNDTHKTANITDTIFDTTYWYSP